MSKPSTRQLMLAICLGIRIPRMDREQVSQSIDEATLTAGLEPSNKRQLQLGKIWECPVEQFATRDAASHRLWNHWEKRFNNGEMLPLPKDVRKQLDEADDKPATDDQLQTIAEYHGILPRKVTRDEADEVIEFLEEHTLPCPFCKIEIFAADEKCCACDRKLDKLKNSDRTSQTVVQPA